MSKHKLIAVSGYISILFNISVCAHDYSRRYRGAGIIQFVNNQIQSYMEDRNQFDYTSKKARTSRYVKSLTRDVYDSLEDAWNALDELRDVVDEMIEGAPDEELPPVEVRV